MRLPKAKSEYEEMNSPFENSISIAAILILVVTMWVGLFIVATNLPNKVTYDCSIAEISPDFPPDVREQCRKLNVRKMS